MKTHLNKKKQKCETCSVRGSVLVGWGVGMKRMNGVNMVDVLYLLVQNQNTEAC
jgi:hypothetical protein